MARGKRPTGDSAYNARRRYYRAAERYLKDAESSTGATAARYRELARQRLNDALKTYDKGTTQAYSKPIQKIANDLGIDLGEERRKTQSRSNETALEIRRAAIDLEAGSKSFRALESTRQNIGTQQLREDEARAVLNSPIGQRIIGGTVEIWEDAARVEAENGKGFKIDKTRILPSLFEYFNVDNIADLLSRIEEIAGDLLYSDAGDSAIYEAVKLTIQNKIASDNSVTA